jgi:hypothetical protein
MTRLIVTTSVPSSISPETKQEWAATTAELYRKVGIWRDDIGHLQFGVMPCHAYFERDLTQCMSRIVLHASDVVVLVKAVAVVDEDRHDCDAKGHGQHQRHHQFDDGETRLFLDIGLKHFRVAQKFGSM